MSVTFKSVVFYKETTLFFVIRDLGGYNPPKSVGVTDLGGYNQNMRKVTLCFLVKGNQILLAMKKEGFGEGKWNGVGGKQEEGESIEQAAVRELAEEIGVKAEVADLENVGDIKFYFDDRPDWHQHIFIFFVNKWQGEPQESDEMRPEWYEKDKLPYEKMWVDDPHWLPKVLEGQKIEAEFYFNNHGAEIDKFDIRERVAI